MVVAPKPRLATADEELEEVFGGPPRLTEREYIWLGQANDEGQPEVMDEEREEATIKELLRLTVTTGEHMNVSPLLALFSFLDRPSMSLLVSCSGGVEAL